MQHRNPLTFATPDKNLGSLEELADGWSSPRVSFCRQNRLRPITAEISQARVFGEPLIPIWGEPLPEENEAFAAALMAFAKRSNDRIAAISQI